MEFGYYPGCALDGSSIEYGKSVTNVFRNMGVDLVEIPDWSCCGASSGHMLDKKLGTALNARNLGLATERGLKEIVAPCPLCSEGMLKALKKMAADPAKRDDIEDIAERKVDLGIKILNIVQAVEQTRDLWGPKLRKDVRKLRIACYYGCLLVRPPDIVNFDEPEKPMSIDNLVNEMGFEAVDWAFKTECCGGGFTVSNAEDVSTLVGKIYRNAIFHKADVIACVCPMCLANLEMAAADAGRKFNTVFKMPVVYLTDLLGLAIGMEPTELALDQHLSDVSSLM